MNNLVCNFVQNMLGFGNILKCLNVRGWNGHVTRKLSSNIPFVSTSEEVRYALEYSKPVVALESTIITHGMPFPQNVECALDVERAVRTKGAIPATIAIINGHITIGLSQNDILSLGEPKRETVKTSRRDLAYVISQGLNGGTTVSATIIIAGKAGIPIFATGGLGGVHRLGEKTFDISADLTELGRSSLTVVCSGVKSILDISKTLEYLETQGVFVATYGCATKEFPAFYCRKSGFFVPYNMETPREAASIIHTNRKMNLNSGMVLAVPAPLEHALDEKLMKEVIDEALALADVRDVRGKEITPFLLARVSEATAGKSLQTNIALVKNNAKVAAEIAVELSRGLVPSSEDKRNSSKQPVVVIGGSVLDRCVALRDVDIKLDGRIHFGKCTESAGGVARNVADALLKLNQAPKFISAVGNDTAGKLLLSEFPYKMTEHVLTVSEDSTAQSIVVFDANGECKFLIGDMDVHGRINPDFVRSKEYVIKDASIMVLDGNCSIEAMDIALELARKHNIPVFFEPTDVLISKKPFATSNWKAIKYISPNLTELKHVAEALSIPIQVSENNSMKEVAVLASKVADYIENVIVTLGANGALVARRADASHPLKLSKSDGNLQVRHYFIGNEIQGIVNVSGAGDCFAAGLIAALVETRSEENCVSVGFAAAISSLQSKSAVPKILFDKHHKSWHTNAAYDTIKV